MCYRSNENPTNFALLFSGLVASCGGVQGPYLSLSKAGRRVDVDGLRIFHGAIRAALLQPCRVVEEAGRDGFPDRVVILPVAGFLDLDALHQPLQLIPNVTRPLHAPHLQARAGERLSKKQLFCYHASRCQ